MLLGGIKREHIVTLRVFLNNIYRAIDWAYSTGKINT